MKTRSVTLAALLILAAVAAHGEIAVVAVGGDGAPDGNGKLFDFDIPSMNREGQVACVTTLGETAGGNNDNTGILLGTVVPGSLSLIVRRGAPSPDGNGNLALFDPNSTPVINDAGQIAFIAGLSGTFGGGLDDTGMFRSDGTPGGLTLLVRQGQSLPDTGSIPNLRGGGFGPFSFNELGQVVFTITGIGIFRSPGGAITPIARSLQPIPGGGGMFTFLSAAALNDSGQVAFADGLSGIFRGDGSTILQIAHAADPAPDGNGNLAPVFLGPAINNNGAVAFATTLSATLGGASDNQGIFIGQGDALTTIVRRGQTAPGGNGRFLDLNSDVAINDTGQVAFLSTLTATAGGGTDNAGLFRGNGTTLTQIVRTGDRVPDGRSINSVGKPALNNAGQVAFLGGLAAAGGLPAAHAIFLFDDRLGLLQAVRTGDGLLGSTIAVGSTLIFEPSVTSNGMKRSSLNARGHVVFRFDLNDGRRGIAIADPFTTPATATPTPSPPPASPSATPTLTPSPSPPIFSVCVGDCNSSRDVTVNELITLVNIALGNNDPSACLGGIPSGVQVDIALIIRAVNDALTACPNIPRR